MTTFPAYYKALEDFIDAYEIELNYPCVPGIQDNIKVKPTSTVCRFCKKMMPEVTFKKRAHLVSNSLGNLHLFSNDECDRCNELFGRFENDINNYFGIKRTVDGFHSVKGAPKFKTPSKDLKATFTDDDDFTHLKIDTIPENINIDTITGKTVVRFKNPSYVPLNVFRIILKFALSILKEQDFINYAHLFKALIGKSKTLPFASSVSVTYLPDHSIPFPSLILFKRKNHEGKLPMHMFVFIYNNHVFQFPLGYHKEDVERGLYNHEGFEYLLCPPILTDHPKDSDRLTSHFVDFSSSELKVGEERTLSFVTNPEELKVGGAYDPRTKKQIENYKFDSNEIKGFLIVKKGANFPLDRLKFEDE